MAGLEVELKRDVAADVATTWAFIVENFFSNHPRWDPAIVELRKLSDGPMAEGTRGLEVRNFGGRQAAEFVVTRLEPQRAFAFSNTTGPFALERSYTFSSAGAGCRFTFRFEMRPRGPMILLFPLLRRTIARQVEDNIGRLCGLLAGGSRNGTPPLRRAG
jgi:hypothetical protein